MAKVKSCDIFESIIEEEYFEKSKRIIKNTIHAYKINCCNEFSDEISEQTDIAALVTTTYQIIYYLSEFIVDFQKQQNVPVKKCKRILKQLISSLQ